MARSSLYIMLLEEFYPCLLLDSDTKIGIFEFGGCNITIATHQLLIEAVYIHTDSINRCVDFLCFKTLAWGTTISPHPTIVEEHPSRN